jgi:tol-pal system protein YbgF
MRLFFLVLVPALCPVLGGALSLACAHEAAEDRQLLSMQEEVNHIAAQEDREYPPVKSEAAQAEAKLPPARSDSAPVPGPGVMQLGEDGTEQGQVSGETASVLNGDDPKDTTPRPSIRVVGSRATRKGMRGPEQVEETIPDEAPNGGTAGPPVRVGAPPPSAIDPDARRAYDAALALVNGQKYDKALDALAAFLIKWPDHPFADNAMYWRGECYYAKGEFARAAEQFEGTMARFPLGNKVPDSLLKLGMCQLKLGNTAKAKTYFDKLQHDFPTSEAARRIPSDRDSPRSAGPTESK